MISNLAFLLVLLTPSLPQPVKFLGWKMDGRTAPSGPNFDAVRFGENAFTCQAKRKRKGLTVSHFVLLLVIFKWHQGSEGVKRDSAASMAVKGLTCTSSFHRCYCLWGQATEMMSCGLEPGEWSDQILLVDRLWSVSKSFEWSCTWSVRLTSTGTAAISQLCCALFFFFFFFCLKGKAKGKNK